MPNFGVTAAGYVLPTQQQLLDLMVADEQATINPNVDTSSDSPIGQINGVVTRQLMIAYEAQQVAYNSNDPDIVEGFLQTNLAKLTGTPRNGATQSVVQLTCNLNVGTTLVAGVTLAAVFGNPASQWTPQSNYTAASTGAFAIPFVSVTTGPNQVAPNAITVMTTSVVGWNSVTNPAAAIPGTNVELDSALRIRREQELQGGGAGNVDAIRAALLKLGEPLTAYVKSVVMLNNTSDVTDANGLPPHSTEAVIWDRGLQNPDTIAQVIWDYGSSGIRNNGTTSGTAADKLRNAQTVFFTRVTQVPIYLAVALTARVGYVADMAFKAQLAALCNGDPATVLPLPGFVAPEAHAFGVGESIDPYDVVMNTAGLGAQVTGLAMDTTAPGTPSAITAVPIAIGSRQIGVFDPSRITVNGL